jgi:DNA-binding NarL/FixJ family response regulator
MDAIMQVAVCAKPGHFRESVVALLKTIPRVEMFLISGTDRESLEALDHVFPDLVLVDLGTVGADAPKLVTALGQQWPAVRVLALSDDIQQMRLAQALGIECTLSKSISAGDFVRIVRQMSARNTTSTGRWLKTNSPLGGRSLAEQPEYSPGLPAMH